MSRTATYHTTVTWQGEHWGRLVMGNGPEMAFSAPPDAEGHAGVLTPEDAFVAAANTCIMMMFIWATERFRLDLVSYDCRAEGTKGSFVVHADGKVEYDIADTANEESQVVYWVLTSIKKDFVAKDPNWLPEHLEALESFWLEVLRHREAGTLPEPPKTERPTLDI